MKIISFNSIKTIRILLVNAILCFSHSLYSQVDQNLENLKNVIPPSPNASSIAKYGEWPVSLYTGVPNIDVPIYTLNGRNLKIPISLSYHSAGLKVGEIASWVGLGWSLNAGGIVTRVVRGLPDEFEYFSNASKFYNPNDFCSTPNSVDDATLLKVRSSKGEGDTQQDVYSFHALGKSYNLIIAANDTVYTKPYSKIKVTSPYSGAQSGWTIVLEDGTIMNFGGDASHIETATNSRYSNATGSTTFTSSWYLKSVVSAFGETISFNYANKTPIAQETHGTESDYIQYLTQLVNMSAYQCPLLENGNNTGMKIEKQESTQLDISSIESENIRVEFIANESGRLDLKNGTTLSDVKIYSKFDNSLIDSYHFNYEYSQAEWGNEFVSDVPYNDLSYYHYRLKLTSLSRYGSTSTPQETWSFEYNPLALPSRRSYAQDHWGFYNGQNSNETLLPKVYTAIPVNAAVYSSVKNIGFMPSSISNHQIGSTRAADENYMQAEILKKIKYPTGGTTSFEYEANGDFKNMPTYNDASANISISNYYGNSYNQSSSSVTFYVPTAQYLYFSFSSEIGYGIYQDFPGATCTASIYNSSGLVASIGNSGGDWYNFLSPGTYTLEIQTNVGYDSYYDYSCYVNMSANVSYTALSGFSNRKDYYGGLRIKSISSIDSLSNILSIKNFTYDSSFVINPIDTLNDYLTKQDLHKFNSYTTLECYSERITRSASTKYSLGAIQGGTVGYGKVTTITNNEGASGKVISIFSHAEDAGQYYTKIFPYPPTDSKDSRRGLLLEERVYNNSGLLIKKTNNSYEFVNKFILSNYVAGSSGIIDPQLCTTQYGDCGIAKVCYDNSVEQRKHLSTSLITYDQNGANPNTVTTNYYYDNPNSVSPIRTVQNNSKGESIKTINLTPLEKSEINGSTPLSASESDAIDNMLARNMISPIVEQRIYKNDNILLKKLFTSYKIWNYSFVAPETIKEQLFSNLIEERVKFNLYDQFGNLLEQQKPNGVKEVYLYGYHSTYPVLKAIGTDYSTISNYLSQSTIEGYSTNSPGLRTYLNSSRNSLPNTLISTYTYKPGIGISSQTDPSAQTNYFEYDGLGRLAILRDKDNNILKQFSYQYKGGQEMNVFNSIGNNVQTASFTSNASCPYGTSPATISYTIPANTYYASDLQTANQLAINALNIAGQSAANAIPCGANINYTNTTSSIWTASFVNVSNSASSSAQLTYSPSSTYLTNLPVGNYNISITPNSSVTSSQLTLNGSSYTGSSFTLSGVSISSGTQLTLQPAAAPCTISMGSGIYSLSNGFNNYGTSVSFYIAFYSTSTIYPGNSIFVGTINGSCKPSSTRTFSCYASGKYWNVTIYSNGNMFWQLSSGSSSVSPYSSIGSSTLTYNL